MCNLACEKRSVEPFPFLMFLLSAQLVEQALGRCLLHSSTPVLGENSAQRCTRCILFPLTPLKGQAETCPFDFVLIGIG